MTVYEPDQKSMTIWSRTGVGNSFGCTGHIRDRLGIHGPVYVFKIVFYCKADILRYLRAIRIKIAMNKT